MPALHVVVHSRPDQAPSESLAPLYGVIDVLVDGVNLTARLGEGQALGLLSELCHATTQLVTGQHRRLAVQMYGQDQVWEIGLELSERQVLVSVYRPSTPALVTAFEKPVGLSQLLEALEASLDETLKAPERAPQHRATPGFQETWQAPLRAARETLRSTPKNSRAPRRRLIEKRVRATRRDVELSVTGTFRARIRGTPPPTPQVERSDLHALLCRGQLELSLCGRTLGTECYPFVVAEQLCQLAEDVARGWHDTRPLMRQVWLGELLCEVRRGRGQGMLEVRVVSKPDEFASSKTAFGRLSMATLLELITDLCSGLAQAVVTADSTQAHNLRLVALIDAARTLRENLDDACRDDSMTNPTPERYRRYASIKRQGTTKPTLQTEGTMRYSVRWLATVPNIELGSTFLCGDRLVVGGARETACLTRHSGTVLWRIPTVSAATTVAPAGLVSIEPNGRVQVHDLTTGHQRFSIGITPPAVGGPAGSVVHCPGLPQLLALAEGDRCVVGIDLIAGQVRWRYRGLRPSKFRLRRAGRLVVLSGDDPSLVALDAATGDVVWKLRDRLPCWSNLAFDSDSAFAVSGGAGPGWRLHHLDPWTGEVRWSIPLRERPLPGHAPLISADSVIVPTLDRSGGGATAYSRSQGLELWGHAPGLVARTAAWMALDGSVVANSRDGKLLCLSSQTGELRFSHCFSQAEEGDQPRRLEPVLRNGALFVPQNGVYVVRPGDGKVLSSLPTDLIPDLIRVDERCDVYVAEESGHVAAFGVAPRLRLLRGCA